MRKYCLQLTLCSLSYTSSITILFSISLSLSDSVAIYRPRSIQFHSPEDRVFQGPFPLLPFFIFHFNIATVRVQIHFSFYCICMLLLLCTSEISGGGRGGDGFVHRKMVVASLGSDKGWKFSLLAWDPCGRVWGIFFQQRWGWDQKSSAINLGMGMGIIIPAS
ncbi:hypothetical protein VNO77_42705 [Canavalia gladiata]|uniref:Uncharacterized protein n=1 Tax=Canavalia gladiata TaxID=3824 RepID=A0AAN9JVJ8_CANGL